VAEQAASVSGDPGINYERLYRFRHRGVDQEARQRVWNEIGAHLYEALGRPQRVLDPAAGRGEFINAVPAEERWVVDATEYDEADLAPGVRAIVGNVLDVPLPAAHFDAVFVSNLLEHFATQDDVARFLGRMLATLAPGGVIAVMGPNFRYCAKDYFDCADHTLALTHIAVEEHLHAAGYEVTRVIPRFLPYSFRGLLPPSPALTRWYLRLPIAWRFLGKQFLLLAQRPAALAG
jgi:SAM-dependent methyltransferase